MTMGYFSTHAKLGWIGAVVFVSLLWSGTTIADGNGDREKGQTIFQESCQHCHGLTGKGDGEFASYFTPPPSNLGSGSTQAKSDTELKDIIMKGRAGTAMAGFEGDLKEPQLNDLLAYLRSLKP